MMSRAVCMQPHIRAKRRWCGHAGLLGLERFRSQAARYSGCSAVRPAAGKGSVSMRGSKRLLTECGALLASIVVQSGGVAGAPAEAPLAAITPVFAQLVMFS